MQGQQWTHASQGNRCAAKNTADWSRCIFTSCCTEPVHAAWDVCLLHIASRFVHRTRCKKRSQLRINTIAGGGAHKYSEIFKEKLGVLLEKEDEMVCLVAGCNFFLKAIMHEAFLYERGTTSFVPTNGECRVLETCTWTEEVVGKHHQQTAGKLPGTGLLSLLPYLITKTRAR